MPSSDPEVRPLGDGGAEVTFNSAEHGSVHFFIQLSGHSSTSPDGQISGDQRRIAIQLAREIAEEFLEIVDVE